MAKNRNDYFKLMEQQIACCAEASAYLCEIIEQFSADAVDEYKPKMHAMEHRGDELFHDILTKLMVEFMTPIDQEDILRLVQIIDDITDALDEAVLDLYMYHVEKIPSGVVPFVKEVNLCVMALGEAVAELRNFKKPQKLREHLIAVNEIEGRADGIFVESIRELYGSSVDAKTLYSTQAIFEGLENCCDLCEHAADVIEQIIIKNT